MPQFLRTRKGRTVTVLAAIALIAAIIVMILLLAGRETGYRNISVSKIFGNVTAENNGNEYEAYENMRLAAGYALNTASESYTRLSLDDDKYVKLEQKSRAVFTNVGDANSHITAINLQYGAMTAELVNPLSEDESFVVNTPNAVLAVRGTFFRIVVSFDDMGEIFTDVYTYGGAVACRRIMPDGTVVDEDVVINQGYKARIKMDEIITVYIEELINYDFGDDVDPLDVDEISNSDIVDMYNASYHGHKMFLGTGELWQEILNRGIDIKEYYSVYDMGEIEEYITTTQAEDTETTTTTAVSSAATSNTTETATETAYTPDESTTAPAAEEPSDGEITGGGTAETASATFPAPTASSANGAGTAPSTASGTAARPSTTSGAAAAAPAETTVTVPSEGNEPVETGGESTSTSAAATSSVSTETETTSSAAETERTTVTVPSVTAQPQITTTGSYPTPSQPSATSSGSYTTTSYPAESSSASPSVSEPEPVETTSDSSSSSPEPEPEPDESIPVDEEHFPDDTFRNYVSSRIDSNRDGYLSKAERDAVTEINVNRSSTLRGEITSLKGIEYFTQLTTLSCRSNWELTSLDISKNTGLKTLDCLGTRLTALDVTKNTELTSLFCDSTGITELDVSNNTELINLMCGGTKITSLDVSRNTKLAVLVCSNTGISELDATNNAELVSLTCSGTGITSLDVSRNTKLAYLTCNSTGITNLDLSHNTELTELYCSGTVMPTLDLTHNTALTVLDFSYSRLASLDLRNNRELSELYCQGTIMTALDLSNNARLSCLDCSNSDIISLDLRNNAELTYLDCSFSDIINLNVSNNPALEYLNCWESKLTALDITSCTALTELYCTRTGISELDVRNCTALVQLNCGGTGITELDLSNNAALVSLDCSYTGITHLDLSNNTELIWLDCSNCKLAFLDLSSCSDLSMGSTVNGNKYPIPAYATKYSVENDPNFAGFKPENVVYVNNATFSDGVFSDIQGDVEYHYDCGNGYWEIFTLVRTLEREGYIGIGEENFPDYIFREYVRENFDADKDGYLSEEECEAAAEIDVSDTTTTSGGITSLDGIEYFTRLKELRCSGNPELTSFDISNNTELTYLDCSQTGLESLDVTGNRELTELLCFETHIEELDLRNNTALEILRCYMTEIEALDVSNSRALTILECSATPITSLNVSNNEALTELYCSYTRLTSLDVSSNTNLTALDCAFNGLAFIDVSENEALTDLYASSNEHLIFFDGDFYDISTDPAFNGFDPSRVSGLFGAEIDEYSGNFFDIDSYYIVYTYDCGQGFEENFALMKRLIPEGYIAISEDSFPDPVFRQYVRDNFDKDNDGYLSEEECEAVVDINVGTTYTGEDVGITSLEGVKYFPNLKSLYCNVNMELTSLDVSNNPALQTLYCNNTGITELDVSNNIALTNLQCYSTEITSLDVSKNTALQYLYCHNTEISSLDVSNNVRLRTLNCYNTEITKLDVSNNTALTVLSCYNTGITSLDVSNNSALQTLYCYYTGLTELDVSNNIALKSLACYGTQINRLDVSNNTELTFLGCFACKLAYVDVSNNPLLTSFTVSGYNIHPVTVGIDRTFDISSDPAFDGFDFDKVTVTNGNAQIDKQSGCFTDIQGDITYDYECGQGYTGSFTLSVTFTDTYSLLSPNQPLSPPYPDLTLPEGRPASDTDGAADLRDDGESGGELDISDPPEVLVTDEGETAPDTDSLADFIEDPGGSLPDSGDGPVEEVLALARGQPP